MLSLIQFLEELEDNHKTVVVSSDDLARLARCYGERVRNIGRWNKSSGELEVPMTNIAMAVQQLDDKLLNEAVQELKRAERFSQVLRNSSAAGQLIDMLAALYLKQFEDKVLCYQNSKDPAETERLRQEISQELFGP